MSAQHPHVWPHPHSQAHNYIGPQRGVPLTTRYSTSIVVSTTCLLTASHKLRGGVHHETCAPAPPAVAMLVGFRDVLVREDVIVAAQASAMPLGNKFASSVCATHFSRHNMAVCAMCGASPRHARRHLSSQTEMCVFSPRFCESNLLSSACRHCVGRSHYRPNG